MKSILITAISLIILLNLHGKEVKATKTDAVERYLLRIQKENELRMDPGLFSSPASEDQSHWDTIWSFRLLHQSSKTLAAEADILQSILDSKNETMIAQYSYYLNLRSFDEMQFSKTQVSQRLESSRTEKNDKGITHYEACLKKISDWLIENDPRPKIQKKVESGPRD